MAAKVGLHSFSINHALPSNKPFGTAMMGQVMYLCSDQQALWFSLDMLMLSAPLCRKLRGDISAQTGVPAEAIVVHVMHNHTSLDDSALDGSSYDIWLHTLVEAAKNAVQVSQPACYCHIRKHDTSSVFVRRRKLQGSGLGKMCVFMGFDPAAFPVADAAKINKARIAQWYGGYSNLPDLPDMDEYDGEVDDVDLLLFRTQSGTPIGSILRFSGHVIAAGHSPIRHYNSDFPGLLRQMIEKRFGGVCMAINGPCGDITDCERVDFIFPDEHSEPFPAPPICMKHANDTQTQAAVRFIADSLYKLFAEVEPGVFAPVDKIRVTGTPVSLPMRDDLVDIPTAARLESEWLVSFRDAVKSKAPLSEVKYAADRWLFYMQHPLFYGEFKYLWPEDLANKTVSADVVSIGIGGILLCAMPGEVFYETGRSIRDAVEASGITVLTAGECNGDIGYLPPADERRYGDYETCACVVAAESVDILAKAALETMYKNIR